MVTPWTSVDGGGPGAGHWGSFPRASCGVGGGREVAPWLALSLSERPCPASPLPPSGGGGRWLFGEPGHNGNERAAAAAGPGLVAAHGLSSSPVCHFFLYKLGVQPGWSFSSPCSPFFPRGERPQNTTQPWLPQAHGEQAPFSPLVSETVVKPRVGKASADILRLPGQTDRQTGENTQPEAWGSFRPPCSLLSGFLEAGLWPLRKAAGRPASAASRDDH